MEPKITIFKKVDRNNPYIIIDKTIYNNKEITWKAKGILTYLCGLPNDWKMSIKSLIKQGPEGYSSISEAINELIENKYIKRTTLRDKNKKIKKWIYLVSEVPFDFTAKRPIPVKPTSRKPINRKAINRKSQSSVTPLNSSTLRKPINRKAINRKSPLTKYIYNKVSKKEKTSKKKTNKFISIDDFKDIPKVNENIEIAEIVINFINYQRDKFGKAVNCDRKTVLKSIDTLDKLIRLDGFTINEIKHTLNYAVTDDFWYDKVLSLGGIREKKKGNSSKFQKLYVRAGRKLKEKKDNDYQEQKQAEISKRLGI